MAVELSEKALKLVEAPNIASVSTVMPDGSPQVTPVWIDHEGNYLLVNTAEGRQKPKNMRRDPRVAISIFDLHNPYQMVTIRGRVVEISPEGADAHIDKMAKKYLGQDRYPFRQPGEKRLLVKIEPEHVFGM